MYVWKLWRDSRSRFLSCTLFGIVWAGLTGYLKPLWAAGSDALQVLRHDAAWQQAVWKELAGDLLPAVTIIGLFAALWLSETGVGGELANGTAEYLLTRPRHRRYFSWSAWLFTAAELLAIMTTMVVCGAACTLYLTRTVRDWTWLMLPLLFIPAFLLVLGSGHVISLLSNGRHGATVTFGLVLLYFAIIVTNYQYWHIRTPHWWFTSLPSWVENQSGPFPFAAIIGWLLVSALCPLLVQWRFAKKEV